MDRDAFLTMVLRNPAHDIIARALDETALPDAWIVSGCLVQTVWNGLTRRRTAVGGACSMPNRARASAIALPEYHRRRSIARGTTRMRAPQGAAKAPAGHDG